ncbi:unnamed protein product [Pleuronectes platessa]|uniref:Secreted protein n=1 Tax=Pleuronectes platessa TaxID=8262 RepID=A0A9N7UN44_PLEPL|nr:unnamed protein product [Pleuronectes platessa]
MKAVLLWTMMVMMKMRMCELALSTALWCSESSLFSKVDLKMAPSYGGNASSYALVLIFDRVELSQFETDREADQDNGDEDDNDDNKDYYPVADAAAYSSSWEDEEQEKGGQDQTSTGPGARPPPACGTSI